MGCGTAVLRVIWFSTGFVMLLSDMLYNQSRGCIGWFIPYYIASFVFWGFLGFFFIIGQSWLFYSVVDYFFDYLSCFLGD